MNQRIDRNMKATTDQESACLDSSTRYCIIQYLFYLLLSPFILYTNGLQQTAPISQPKLQDSFKGYSIVPTLQIR